jgi:hypothetical protein
MLVDILEIDLGLNTSKDLLALEDELNALVDIRFSDGYKLVSQTMNNDFIVLTWEHEG